MKRTSTSLLLPLAAAFAAAGVFTLLPRSPAAHAQDLETVATAGLPTWEPGRAVTTSIKDALPVVTTLKGCDEAYVQPIPDDWNFAPGYYRSVIRSYCLHAGAYGPTKGDGYLIAPLKGDRVPVIRNILIRSVKHPDIPQQDVQRLIWGTEDGAQWKDYEDDFKVRVAPLLSPEEIAILNMEPQRAAITDAVKSRLGGLIPGAAKRAVDQYANLRDKITGSTSYADLESVAVKTGVAPWGKDSRKDVKPGAWAYVGDGFYMRAFPESYPTTTLEIYRVAPAKLTRDARGRITRFDSDGDIIDTTYSDTPDTETIDGKPTRVWRFKTVTFRNAAGQTYTINNTGYVVAETGAPSVRLAGQGSASLCADGDGGLGDMGHYRDGLKTAFNPTDKKGQLDWINKHMGKVGAAWDAASGALAGDNSDPKPHPFDPTHHTATPANTSMQRLALSGIKK